MKQRISIKDVDPEAYKAMGGFSHYVNHVVTSPLHREMIKVRASMINGCAYCIQLHAGEARRLGETDIRIYALSAWHESPFFSEEERAILALTDEVTMISDGGVSDPVFEDARKYFDEKTISQIIMQIIAINSWNRIAVATHMFHPTPNG